MSGAAFRVVMKKGNKYFEYIVRCEDSQKSILFQNFYTKESSFAKPAAHARPMFQKSPSSSDVKSERPSVNVGGSLQNAPILSMGEAVMAPSILNPNNLNSR